MALMLDQREKFQSKGLTAECIEDNQVVADVLNVKIQLVFISPESIVANSRYWQMLTSNSYQEKLVAVAVGEAHCIKTWLVIRLLMCIYTCMNV